MTTLTDAEIAALKAKWEAQERWEPYLRSEGLRLIAALEESRRERADMVMKCAAQIPGERATARALAFEKAAREIESIERDANGFVTRSSNPVFASRIRALATLPPALRAVSVVTLAKVEDALEVCGAYCPDIAPAALEALRKET